MLYQIGGFRTFNYVSVMPREHAYIQKLYGVLPPPKVSELAYTNVNNRFYVANRNDTRVFPDHACPKNTNFHDIILLYFTRRIIKIFITYICTFPFRIALRIICLLAEPFWRNADAQITSNRVKGQIPRICRNAPGTSYTSIEVDHLLFDNNKRPKKRARPLRQYYVLDIFERYVYVRNI